ncbi:MAG TPA: gluconeogenesis factor YvcK family protein, partial [Gemmatimonadales bacterium]|nr:gluconeogenesis factor YvcK family protein [Gemmatimonadales bacterium]
MASRLASTTRWLRWLTPGLQIKRWLLLLMVSELVLVLGVAYALKEIYQTAHLPSSFYWITLQFLPYWARAFVFGVFGVGLLLLSYLKLTQSVLGPFLPGTNTSSLVEVIHAFRLRGRGPRIVAIGGGTGLSSLLRGLKTYTSNLSAIVTVADDGGSSGRLRTEFNMPAPGDIRNCLVALADSEALVSDLFQYR